MSDSAGDAEVFSDAGRVIEPGSLPGVGGLGPGFEGGDSVAAPLSAFIAGDLIDHIGYTAMFPSFAAVVIAALLPVATLRVGRSKAAIARVNLMERGDPSPEQLTGSAQTIPSSI